MSARHPRRAAPRPDRRCGATACAVLAAILAAVEGCASHSERMLPMRTALDVGNPHEAIRLLDRALDVGDDRDLPADLGGDKALLVLDRGSVQQSVARFDRSKRDLEAADRAVDMLDLAHDAKDTIGEYVFSGSSGKYQAPPYEKLLVNTLDMLNYLELRDLSGARVEGGGRAGGRRCVADELNERENAVLGLGAMLAGLVFEKSHDADEALRWYDQALAFRGFRALRDPVRTLMQEGRYRSSRLEALGKGGAESTPDEAGQGEVIVVIGYGRVPHKIAERVPIGLALTWYADALAPHDLAAANQLAAQGLVTWINFPTLGHESRGYDLPTCTVDGAPVALEEAVDVTREVRAEWKKIEGKVVVSAITRMVARYAAGRLASAAGGRNDLIGTLLSLGTQVTLTVLDTPDTRSWETLPARVAFARVRVSAGKHAIQLSARGVSRSVNVDVDRGDWSVASLMALR